MSRYRMSDGMLVDTANAEFKAYLARCGISLDTPQETKTRTALEIYSKALKSEQPGG